MWNVTVHRQRKQGGKGGTDLWQASDLHMSHVVKFDVSVALVYALHELPFNFSLL